MKTILTWNEKMTLTATAENNSVQMDAKSPIGSGSAMTPKELVAAGLGGCTAMDVLALLKKHKQQLSAMNVEIDITSSVNTHPAVFTAAELVFDVKGEIMPDILLNAIADSQTKYCGISAMLSKAFPIRYKVILNNENIGQGEAHFEN